MTFRKRYSAAQKRAFARRMAKKRRPRRRYGKKKSGFRNPIPRTLPLATLRPKHATLRFVKHLTYEINPQSNSENIFLTIRANSIADILSNNGSQNQPSTWIPQDNDYVASTGVELNADGYTEWKERFLHFTVLGSKVTASYQPYQLAQTSSSGVLNGSIEQAVSTLYINKTGLANVVSPTTTMSSLVQFPYTTRKTIMPSVSGKGAFASMSYSAKRFENVKDVLDNNNLKGSFDNAYGSGSQPSEKSYFNVGIVPLIEQTLGGSSDKKPPAGLLRLNISYVVALSEPTLTNQVSL